MTESLKQKRLKVVPKEEPHFDFEDFLDSFSIVDSLEDPETPEVPGTLKLMGPMGVRMSSTRRSWKTSRSKGAHVEGVICRHQGSTKKLDVKATGSSGWR